MEWILVLQQELDSWRGTPYRSGWNAKGRGADCVQFTDRVYNALYRTDHPKLPVLPPDISLHDREGAMRTVGELCRRYPCHRVPATDIEPGDAVVFRTSANPKHNPGHVGIAGMDPRTLWHMHEGYGLREASIQALTGRIEAVYRMERKESWHTL